MKTPRREIHLAMEPNNAVANPLFPRTYDPNAVELNPGPSSSHRICPTRSAIMELFTDTEKHPDKCLDFPLSFWLNQYAGYFEPINFPEAATLVCRASAIYGRKVNYLGDTVVNMCKDGESTTDADGDAPKPKERRKRNTIKIIDDNVEISAAPIKRKTIADLCETISVSNDFQPIGERFEQMPSVPKKSSGAQRSLVYKRIALIQNKQTTDSTTFGRVPVVKEDDVDSRMHYSVFVNCMDMNDNTIMQKMQYDCDRLRDDDSANGKDVESAEVPWSKYSRQPFHVYKSPTYMKRTFDLDVDSESDYRNMQRFQQEMKNVLTMNLEEMYQYRNGCYLNGILRGGQPSDVLEDEGCSMDAEELEPFTDLTNVTDLEHHPITNESSQRHSLSQTFNNSLPASESTRIQNGSITLNGESECDSGIVRSDSHDSGSLCSNLTTTTLAEHPDSGNAYAMQVAPISKRNISIDEGLGGSNSSSSVRSFSPTIELFDIFNGIGNKMSLKEKQAAVVSLDRKLLANLFGIRRDYLTTIQQFSLPGAIFEREIPMRMNILQLPERKLRKSKLFQLPEEFNIWKNTAKRKNLNDLPATTRKMMKMITLSDTVSCVDSVDLDESTGFAGFDELDLSAIHRDHTASHFPLSTSPPRCSSPVDTRIPAADSLFPSQTSLTSNAPPPGSVCTQSSFRDSGFGDMDSMIQSTQSTLPNAEMSIEEAPRPSETLPQFNFDDPPCDTPADGEGTRNLSDGRQARIDDMKTMSKRVSDWHNSLRHILQESQGRNSFDIHEYGTHIIELIKSKGAESTFEDVLTGREPSSIANYFLSMLQLVNVGNIDISVSPENTVKVCAPSDIHLRLLSETRHASEIDNNMQAK